MNSKYDTIWPADSVEFCPHALATSIIACGTYRLVQPEDKVNETVPQDSGAQALGKQVRQGKLLMLDTSTNETEELCRLDEVRLAAVLDLKWDNNSQGYPRIAVADSEGHISTYRWQTQQKQLEHEQTVQCKPSEVLVLSLDWSNKRLSTVAGSITASCSDGSLCILRPATDGAFAVTDSWHAHDYEPWITAWNYWDPNIVFSGGDDLKLFGWDLRQGPSPTFVNKRFDAGVISIQNHPYVEHLIAVGSYDETVRLIDLRKPQSPLVQASVGGGAWRVKWHPDEHRKSDLLVACMHGGFKVVRFSLDLAFEQSSSASGTEGQPGWEVVKRFDEHQSLAYGVDWSHEKAGGETVIASCSFYDHLLHVWSG